MSNYPDKVVMVIERLCYPLDQGRRGSAFELDTSNKDKDELSKTILNYFETNQQEKQLLERKVDLWKQLQAHLSSQMECELIVKGSTINGFGSSGCDMDMSIFTNTTSVKYGLLNRVDRIIRKECSNFQSGELISAKVPLLKMRFRDPEAGTIHVDLIVGNGSGVRNTHLLYYYSQLDPRVRPLVLAVKWWAKKNGINEPRYMTLSSYTLTLMVIHYLQSGVSPPVLPCLQEKHPDVFHPGSDLYNLDFDDKTILCYSSVNKQSIGSLFTDFLKYFTDSRR